VSLAIAPVEIRPRGGVKKNPKRIGLAIIGAGRVGLFAGSRGAASSGRFHRPGRTQARARQAGRGKGRRRFRHRGLPRAAREAGVTAAIVSTDEHLHVDPILAAVERKIPLLIENRSRPAAIRARARRDQKSGVDAVVGYTQRFRRRWLVAKEKVRTERWATSRWSRRARS